MFSIEQLGQLEAAVTEIRAAVDAMPPSERRKRRSNAPYNQEQRR